MHFRFPPIRLLLIFAAFALLACPARVLTPEETGDAGLRPFISDVEVSTDSDFSSADVRVAPVQRNVRIENASNSLGTLSHDADLVAHQGILYFAFAEPRSEETSVQNVFVGTRDPQWSSSAQTDLESQAAFPMLLSEDDVLHLVYSANLNGNQDVFYARDNGFGLGLNLNMTAAFENENPHRDIHPQLVGSDDDAAILYLSDRQGEGLAIFMLQLQGASPTGTPQEVFSRADGFCSAFDALSYEGVIHLVAECGENGSGELYYINDLGPSFAGVEVDIAPALGANDPKIARSDEGIHYAFKSAYPCSDGGNSCSQIFYGQRRQNTFVAPLLISEAEDSRAFAPNIACAAEGEVAVAYHRFLADENRGDVMVAIKESGGEFALTSLTPDSPEEQQTSVGGMVYIGDRLHVLFEELLFGSEPLNAEVMHAEVTRAN